MMGWFLLLSRRVTRIPHRLYWEVRIWILTLPRLWWINRYGHASILEAGGPVVSLTSYGIRVRTVYLTIESIARGYKRPSRIILWVEDDSSFRNPPAPLRRLVRRGLEIRLCTSYGPHTKYFPYVETQDHFHVPLVTADDDQLYPRDWLKTLAEGYGTFPTAINCHWALAIGLQDKLAKYTSWGRCGSTEPNFRQIALGVSGVIYPPAFLRILKAAGSAFQSCCPKADDLWLHVQALRAGYKIRQLRSEPLQCLQVPGSQGIALGKENKDDGGNDRQVEATYTAEDINRMLEV
jgi:hypothetical protein